DNREASALRLPALCAERERPPDSRPHDGYGASKAPLQKNCAEETCLAGSGRLPSERHPARRCLSGLEGRAGPSRNSAPFRVWEFVCLQQFLLSCCTVSAALGGWFIRRPQARGGGFLPPPGCGARGSAATWRLQGRLC